jgi:2-hydroxy-6-oxonona-2,4-dienedioate hydrolase
MTASMAPATDVSDASLQPLAGVRAGEGPVMVLLHGGVGSSGHWIRNIPVLAERFHVIAFDLPGYGNSPDVPRGTTPDAYVEWVSHAVKAAAPDHCHLVGFSFGGALAARVAVQLGRRVVKLSLLGSGGFGVPVGRNIATASVPGPEADVAARRAAAAANLGQWMLSMAPAPDDPIVDMQLSNIDRTRFDSRRVSLRPTLLDDLARIPAAVQMIWGTEDRLAHPSVQARADACRAVRDDIKISFVPGSGHWIQYEHAADINQYLIDFHAVAPGATKG